MTDLDRFNKFVAAMQVHYPKLRIDYKDESLLMKILGKILFFNKDFSTHYITTIGSTVYFPSRKWIEDNPTDAMLVLSHECVHIADSIRLTAPLFTLMYMAPQILVLLMIAAFFFIGWWALLFLLFLAPLPSPGRMYLEKRGYRMTLFALDRRFRELGLSDDARDALLKQNAANIDKKYFAGPAYYFMWPFGLSSWFDDAIKAINSGDILDVDEVFRFVDGALESSKS
jgi:hypothetical protein